MRNHLIKWSTLSLLLTLIHGLAYPQTPERIDKDLIIHSVMDSIFIATHSFPWESNSMIFITDDSMAVFIDTPYTPEATQQLLDWVDSKFLVQKIIAINTGFHIDNLGGNGCLLKHGIPIYGADLTAQLVDDRSAATHQQTISWLKPSQERIRKAYEKLKFEKPDHLYPIHDGMTLLAGNLTFEVYYPGESHTPDNVVVFIPEKKLLFGGCMIKSLESKNLGFTGDANVSEWPVSVEKVKYRYPEAQLVIPHHGKWGDPKLLDHTIALGKTADKAE